MYFELTADQKLLSDTVQSFVKKESPIGRMRSLRDDPVGWSRETWRKMAELGWLSILFPESLGGYGGSFVDAGILLGHFGTTLVPEPYVPSVVVGGMAILRAGDEGQRRRWIEPLIAGEISLALAHAERDSRFDVTHVASKAERSGALYRLTG